MRGYGLLPCPHRRRALVPVVIAAPIILALVAQALRHAAPSSPLYLKGGSSLTYVIPCSRWGRKPAHLITRLKAEVRNVSGTVLIHGFRARPVSKYLTVGGYELISDAVYKWEVVEMRGEIIKARVTLWGRVRSSVESPAEHFKREATVLVNVSSCEVFTLDGRPLGKLPILLGRLGPERRVTIVEDGELTIEAETYWDVTSQSLSAALYLCYRSERFMLIGLLRVSREGLLAECRYGYADPVLYKLLGVKAVLLGEESMKVLKG